MDRSERVIVRLDREHLRKKDLQRTISALDPGQRYVLLLDDPGEPTLAWAVIDPPMLFASESFLLLQRVHNFTPATFFLPVPSEEGFLDIALNPPTRADALTVISPLAFYFFYLADLGPVDPLRPPGPDNGRLKDKLTFFNTAVGTEAMLVRLLGIALAVVEIKTRSWELLEHWFWNPLFHPFIAYLANGEIDLPDYIEEYRAMLTRWKALPTFAGFCAELSVVTPLGGDPDHLPVCFRRLLFLASTLLPPEVALLIPPIPGDKPYAYDARSDEEIVTCAYNKYADAYEEGILPEGD